MMSLVTSHYLKSLHAETMARIYYPCGAFKHTLKKNIVLKCARSYYNYRRRSNSLGSVKQGWDASIVGLRRILLVIIVTLYASPTVIENGR